MDPNPYIFNRDIKYPARMGFPQKLSVRDLQEANIQVVAPEVVSGRGDFTVQLQDVFRSYRLPHISSESIITLWSEAPMGFYQNQVNFAMWCATTGCGVSWRDHLDIDRPLARAVFRFHVYYQMRRILSELQAPLPQDKAWVAFHNPYDRRAYERICREFQVDPATDWRQKSSESGGLGIVYQSHRPKGSFNPSRMRFQPDSSLSADSSLWAREHVDYIAQSQEAATAWSGFVLEKSQGFTAPGVERLNDSIRTYVWALLGAQAQTRSAILGVGTSFDAQKQFQANLEDAISSPTDLPSAIERYQSVLQYASSKVNYAFGVGLYMAPSDMRLHIGTIAGYNNKVVIAPSGQPLGVSEDINSAPVTPPIATREEGLIKPDHAPASTGLSPLAMPPASQAGKEHEDEKTAIVVGFIVVGLLALWFS